MFKPILRNCGGRLLMQCLEVSGCSKYLDVRYFGSRPQFDMTMVIEYTRGT